MKYLEERKQIILDLGFNEKQWDKLVKYVEVLWASNEELNLFSRKIPFEELIDNHIIDCLLPLKYLPKDIKSIADFGTGGGLPAVIYAINFPEIEFHLYEKSVLKQKFLTKCKNLIARNLFIQGDIPLTLKNIDVVTARAFKPLDVILDMSRNYYQAGGKYFLLKGRMEKIQEELTDSNKKFKNLKICTVGLKSPVIQVERYLVTIGI